MLRAARICGLVPMAAGLAILAVWFLTGIAWLELAGALLLSAGTVIVLAGVVCLAVFTARAALSGQPYLGHALRTLALLAANFPVAFLCILVATAVIESDMVILRNASASPAANVTLTGPTGETHALGPLAPGEARAYCTSFAGEGAVQFAVENGAGRLTGTAVGYTTSMIGSRAEIELTGEGPPVVRESAGRVSAREFLGLCLFYGRG